MPFGGEPGRGSYSLSRVPSARGEECNLQEPSGRRKREARTPLWSERSGKSGRAGDATSFARPPLTHVHVICIGSAIATGSLSRVDFSASSERPKIDSVLWSGLAKRSMSLPGKGSHRCLMGLMGAYQSDCTGEQPRTTTGQPARGSEGCCRSRRVRAILSQEGYARAPPRSHRSCP